MFNVALDCVCYSHAVYQTLTYWTASPTHKSRKIIQLNSVFKLYRTAIGFFCPEFATLYTFNNGFLGREVSAKIFIPLHALYTQAIQRIFAHLSRLLSLRIIIQCIKVGMMWSLVVCILGYRWVRQVGAASTFDIWCCFYKWLPSTVLLSPVFGVAIGQFMKNVGKLVAHSRLTRQTIG